MQRHKTNTLQAAQEAIKNAQMPALRWPASVTLRECDEPFWEAVIKARSRAEWNECDLVLAAQLARSMADIEALDRDLHAEGFIIYSASGVPKINKKLDVSSQIFARQMAIMRSLQIAGSSRNRIRDVERQRELEKNFLDFDGDGLIAR
jgi:hypothetical protein